MDLALPEEQAYGAFDQGKIEERKPIGFPKENSKISSFSNLFYWAYAWSPAGGEIGIHPHQGFEIASFILSGQVEHFDTEGKEWKPLESGGAQIIRAGTGISHSEKMAPGTSIFQVWFDPDLSVTMKEEPSYSDYKKSDFPLIEDENGQRRIIVGKNSPFELRSQVEVVHYYFQPGTHEISTKKDSLLGIFCLEGKAKIDGLGFEKNSFLKIYDQNKFSFECEEYTELFVIEVPHQVEYSLFMDRYKS